MDRDNHFSFDIEDPPATLERLLEEELAGLSPESSEASICRVPKRLLEVNEKAYSPQAVSIGPFHHGKEGLKAMEEYKLRCLKNIVEWTNLSLAFFIETIGSKEERLRTCYREDIQYSSKKFVKIILVDAAFIIGFLIKHLYPFLGDRNDGIFNSPSMLLSVRSDMLMLGNQLPFFILEEFFGHVHVSVPYMSDKMPSIRTLLLKFFFGSWDSVRIEDTSQRIQSCSVAHCLDLVRSMVVPFECRLGAIERIIYPPCITELYYAGIKFKLRPDEELHFSLDPGILEIPRLRLGPLTEILLRNLVVMEECSGNKNYVSDFVVIMSQLLKTQNDVDILVKYGILENLENTNKILLSLIHELAAETGINYNGFSFADLCEKLNRYNDYRNKWIAYFRKWVPDLKKNYFSSPWKTISVIVASVLLGLTLIQTVCSVISTGSSRLI